MKRSEIFWLAALLSFAFLLRLGVALGPWALDPQASFEPDSRDYVRLADSLFDQSCYGPMDAPELNRAPGYPFFLSALMLPSALLGFNFVPLALAVQALLDVAVCLLVWLTLRVRLRCGALPSFAGLLLQILSAAAMASCSKLLSESLFTFLSLSSIWFLLPSLSASSFDDSFKERSRDLAVSGLLWALACLTRVAAFPLTPLLAFAPCAASRRFFPALVFLAPSVLLLCGWTARNGILTGDWELSTVSSINLYRYDACAVEASLSKRPFAEVQAEIDAKLSVLPDQAAVGRFCREEGLKSFKAHPLAFFLIHVKGVVVSLLPAEGDIFKSFGVQVGGNGALSTILSQGFVAGVERYLNGRWLVVLAAAPLLLLLLAKYLLAALWPLDFPALRECLLPLVLLTLFVAWFLLAGGAASTPRFRAPAEPELAILAAFSLAVLLRRFKR